MVMIPTETLDQIDAGHEARLAAVKARYDARIAELEALVESLQNRWASRPLSSEDAERRIAELERENERLSHRIDLFEDGEYICAKCGLRQEPPKQDAPF